MKNRRRFKRLFLDAKVPAADKTSAEEPERAHSARIDQCLIQLGLTEQELAEYDERIRARQDRALHTMSGASIGVGVWALYQAHSFAFQHGDKIRGGIRLINKIIETWDDLMPAFDSINTGDIDWAEALEGLASMTSIGLDALDLSADNYDLLFDLAEHVVDGVDIAEGVASLGISVAIGVGIKELFKYINKEDEEKLKIIQAEYIEIQKLQKMLELGLPATAIAAQMKNVSEPVLATK